MKASTTTLLPWHILLSFGLPTARIVAYLSPKSSYQRGNHNRKEHNCRNDYSVARWYEPLPNDSLGNYLSKNEDLPSQNNMDPIPTTTSMSSASMYDSDDSGLIRPNPNMSALQVATVLIEALHNCPNPHESLELCFHFSSDRCRAAVGGNLKAFVKYANNPTFGSLVHCQDWRVLSVGSIIPGSLHRGDMQTVLIQITKPLTVRAALEIKAREERKSGRRRPTIEERMRAREQRERDLHLIDKEDGAGDFMNKEADGKKTFLWTLQKERRPPRQDCWLVHEVLYQRNAFLQTFWRILIDGVCFPTSMVENWLAF